MKFRRHLAGAVALVVGATVLVVGAAGPAEAAPGQSAGPNPVVIVGGTGTGEPIASVFYTPLRRQLEADGYQAFIFGPPNFGLGDIGDASAALDSFVDNVMAQTGSDTVDLVGHSQGGLIGRDYIRFRGGEAHVDNMVSLGAPHHGTSVANLLRLLGLGNCLGVVACEQMTRGSDYLGGLNAGDESWGDVQYTNIATRYDGIVNPWRTAFLADDVNNVNVDVQGHCWARIVGHIGLAFDAAVYSGIRQALEGRPIDLNCWAI